MFIKKLITFGFISLISASMFTVSLVAAYEIPSIIKDGSVTRLPSDAKELIFASLFIGTIHALIFALLEWRKKSESLVYILLSTFLAVELIVIIGYVNMLIAITHHNFQESNIHQILVSAQNSPFPFIRNSLIVMAFTIFAGVLNKKLLMNIKKRFAMP